MNRYVYVAKLPFAVMNIDIFIVQFQCWKHCVVIVDCMCCIDVWYIASWSSVLHRERTCTLLGLWRAVAVSVLRRPTSLESVVSTELPSSQKYNCFYNVFCLYCVWSLQWSHLLVGIQPVKSLSIAVCGNTSQLNKNQRQQLQ